MRCNFLPSKNTTISALALGRSVPGMASTVQESIRGLLESFVLKQLRELIQELEKLVPNPKSFNYFRTGIPFGRLQNLASGRMKKTFYCFSILIYVLVAFSQLLEAMSQTFIS
jgi:hypothetical protein